MPMRVLIVEDEELIALDLQEILEGDGHTVVGQATTADEAVKLATKHKPDVALMDVELSDGSNGLVVAEALGRKLKLPVVFLTARNDFMVRAMTLEPEPLGYITKPFIAADVLSALAALQPA